MPIRGREEPPLDLVRWVGAASLPEFEKTGEDFVAELERLCSLHPSSSVLDVGCGVGRLAIPLQSFLGENGSYAGFDAHLPAVKWCLENVGDGDPRFRFNHFDLHNAYYNPAGSLDPSTWRWPFCGEQFDVVCLISVFTHLLPPTTMQYMREMWRVLKFGGSFLATFFLVPADEDGGGRCELVDIHLEKVECEVGIDAWGSTSCAAEAAVAYREVEVVSMLQSIGFNVDMLSGGQDIVWGTKVIR